MTKQQIDRYNAEVENIKSYVVSKLLGLAEQIKEGKLDCGDWEVLRNLAGTVADFSHNLDRKANTLEQMACGHGVVHAVE